jgi:hypothetical protein
VTFQLSTAERRDGGRVGDSSVQAPDSQLGRMALQVLARQGVDTDNVPFLLLEGSYSIKALGAGQGADRPSSPQSNTRSVPPIMWRKG